MRKKQHQKDAHMNTYLSDANCAISKKENPLKGWKWECELDGHKLHYAGERKTRKNKGIEV